MRVFFTVVTSLAMVGCATGYQPTNIGGGFSETRLSENTWRVVFRGNPLARADRTEDLALMRAADVALQSGFAVIQVQRSATTTSTITTSMPTYTTVQGRATTSGNQTRFSGQGVTYGGDDTDEIVTSTLLIAAFKNKPTDAKGDIYDARFLCDSIGKKYEVKCQALNIPAR